MEKQIDDEFAKFKHEVTMKMDKFNMSVWWLSKNAVPCKTLWVYQL